MKLFNCIILSVFLVFVSFENATGQINNYAFEQLDSLQKSQKKNIVVFIYTNWCKYCDVFKHTTLKDESLIEQIRNKFYFISLDAEERKTILFRNVVFKFNANGVNTGVHELASELATIEGKISYPTICILNANYEIVFQYQGFMNVKELKTVLEKIE